MFKDIHQTVTFAATPEEFYDTLLTSEKHQGFTDAPANVSHKVGDSFTCYGEYITGVNVELVPGKRIVQAWRGANWPEGVHSLITFNLEEVPEGVRLDFHHVGVPEDVHAHISQGWKDRYWARLDAWFARS